MNGVFYDTDNINLPKNENPLSFWGYVLNFPEAFGSFLARRSMYSKYLDLFWSSVSTVLIYFLSVCKTEKDQPTQCLVTPRQWVCTILFSILPNNMLLTFYLILNAAQK